jgi:hypothetical protein
MALLAAAWLLGAPAARGQAKKPPVAPPGYKIADFKVTMGEGKTLVLERPTYVRYESPYFIANATLSVVTPSDQSYTFGFIQQIDAMDLKIDFGKAFTSWEHPKLPVCDGESGARVPWYNVGVGRGMVKAEQRATVTLSMDDHVTSDIAWKEPLPANVKVDRPPLELRSIKRDQKFTVWLVAMRDSDKRITVLKKVNWRVEVDISVDPSKPVGSRCKVNAVPFHQPQVEAAMGQKVPPESLRAPTANESQELWWNPRPNEPGQRTRVLSAQKKN